MATTAGIEVVNAKNLAITAAKGVLWTGGGQIARQLIQIAGQLALVRLLSPDDFGLLGMAMFFIGIGQLIANFGVGSAIVQSRTDDSIVLSSCFWLNNAVAAGLALLVLVSAPWIGGFYHRPDLTPLVALLSLNLLLSGLQVMPNALLYRDMRFAELARAQVLGSLGGAIASVAMAWAGAGVWALAAQPLIGTAVNIVICWWYDKWIPRFEFNWKKVEPLARFSFSLLGSNLVGYANRNVDALMVGRVLGAGPLGLYSMAIQLMLYPLQQVSSVIVRVLFPTLVQIKDDLPRLRSAYLKAVNTIALITFPLMTGLFVMADDFVPVVLGQKWNLMIPTLRVLTWVGMMQSVATTVGSIYLSTGTPAIALRVSLICAPGLIAAMAAGLYWGIFGVAVGYALATAVIFYYSAIVAFRLIDLKIGDFHKCLSKPMFSSVMMMIVLVISNHFLSDIHQAERFFVDLFIGAASYCLSIFLIGRREINELMSIVRSLRASR